MLNRTARATSTRDAIVAAATDAWRLHYSYSIATFEMRTTSEMSTTSEMRHDSYWMSITSNRRNASCSIRTTFEKKMEILPTGRSVHAVADRLRAITAPAAIV